MMSSTTTTYHPSKNESTQRIRYRLEQLKLEAQPRRRLSTVELRMRQRFNRFRRQKNSKTGPSQINGNKIEDDWIEWMLIWKTVTSIRQDRAYVVGEHKEIDQQAFVLLKQAFLRRSELGWRKRNEFLSPEDAAIRIQMSFMAYLRKKSQLPQALRDLDFTNTELKKIRCSFKGSSYRERLARDPEENQRFAGKIIVLLLTFYGIEGPNANIRVAKKLMVDEIEKLLDKVRGSQSQNFVASMKDFLPLSEPIFEPAKIRMARWHRSFKCLLPLPNKGEESRIDWIRTFQKAKIFDGIIPSSSQAKQRRPLSMNWPTDEGSRASGPHSYQRKKGKGRQHSPALPPTRSCVVVGIRRHFLLMNDISDSGWLPHIAAVTKIQRAFRATTAVVIKIQRTFRARLMRRSHAAQKIQRTLRAHLKRRSHAAQKIQRTFRAYLKRRSHAAQKIQRTFRAHLKRRSHAAQTIQRTFRAYLRRRSWEQAYRELALVETKLGEIRFHFNDLSYRHHIARDAEECQRFAEKIIVLFLTVDAIKGTNEMTRSFKKSMVDELEAMLNVIDDNEDNVEKYLVASMEPMLEEKDEEATGQGSVLLSRAFPRRVGKGKEKRNELSPVDAAIKIQRSYRDHLARKSQALQAYRDLAVMGTKLKEIKCLLNDFSYCQRVARSTEERQKFAEKIIVLIQTTDTIVGVNMKIRGSKNCIVNELEAMLDVVDPQTPGVGVPILSTII